MVEDFADLTISEKEILEVIGEELHEDVEKEETREDRKVSVPVSNVVSKSNLAEVTMDFFILFGIQYKIF